MAPYLLSPRSDNVTSNDTSTSFCSAAGGTWPAVQSLVAFLVTNIFAHAATIYITNGAQPLLMVWEVFTALLLPVNAGDRAFHVLIRYGRRLFKCQIKGIKNAFGGQTFA